MTKLHHNIFETTAGARNFVIIVDEKQNKTYLYMETDKKDIYYLEDHIWSTGNTMEEKAQYAEQYIKKYIDIMEENRGFYMEKALTKEPINGYQRIINKNLLNNAN